LLLSRLLMPMVIGLVLYESTFDTGISLTFLRFKTMTFLDGFGDRNLTFDFGRIFFFLFIKASFTVV